MARVGHEINANPSFLARARQLPRGMSLINVRDVHFVLEVLRKALR